MLPDRVVSNWWRRDGHSLAMEDFDGVLDELLERLILGIGAYGQLHPDPGVIAALERRGVAVDCLHTDDAVRGEVPHAGLPKSPSGRTASTIATSTNVKMIE